ncbi:hypothetical protein CsatB_020892 [Cannabis sativa]|uniref:Uncharacterized protein n=1 Tax=Cannabis sativa TaxID=3483 RepID=A0A803QKA1_CANSA
MNTLVRSTTSTLSRRFDGYEPLDHQDQRSLITRDDRSQVMKRIGLSKSKRSDKKILEGNRLSKNNNNSRSYRNKRAKHRQIFLKSYTLTPVETRKVEDLATKVKKALVSALSLIRFGSSPFGSCNCRSTTATNNSSAKRVLI